MSIVSINIKLDKITGFYRIDRMRTWKPSCFRLCPRTPFLSVIPVSLHQKNERDKP